MVLNLLVNIYSGTSISIVYRDWAYRQREPKAFPRGGLAIAWSGPPQSRAAETGRRGGF